MESARMIARQLGFLWRWLNREAILYTLLAVWLLLAGAVTLLERRTTVSCAISWTSCLFSQGKLIPSDAALKLRDLCDEFTTQDIGHKALSLSEFEILQENQKFEKSTGGRGQSPLIKAHFSYKELWPSALLFDRGEKDPSSKYVQIKQSCIDLSRDFWDDTKWTQ